MPFSGDGRVKPGHDGETSRAGTYLHHRHRQPDAGDLAALVDPGHRDLPHPSRCRGMGESTPRELHRRRSTRTLGRPGGRVNVRPLDTPTMSRQEAITHTYYITGTQGERWIIYHLAVYNDVFMYYQLTCSTSCGGNT